MPTGTDYLPVATAAGANVDSQADFAGSGYQLNGFNTGLALPQEANKIWRQASMAIALLGNFIANTLSIYIADDGNLTSLLTNFVLALKGMAFGLVEIAFSTTPVFSAAAGNSFEITLTGSVASSSFTNLTPGIYNFIIHQDGAGGHSFVWPPNVPGADIDQTANATNVQAFLVDGANNVHPYTGLTVS